MQGRAVSASDVEELAKLPPLDVLRGQVLGAVIAPLSSIAALVNAPLQNLYGLIEARIEQLQARGEGPATADEPEASANLAQAEETPADAETDQASESQESSEDQEAETDGGS
jgi:large subunit ribosomal protein L10